MDAFFASVEQRDNPELRGKAIAVGGGEKRGVVTTASYEARKFGVKSAMPGFKAKQMCPELIFVPPRFDVYKSVSREIQYIFNEYTDLVEPLSLDEAFLDVTKSKVKLHYAMEIATSIKGEIYNHTGLTASAGISYCKFLAKIASDINKPDGLTVIRPHEAETFLENLEINKFHGVGKVTAKKMNERNIFNGKDLKKWSKVDLVQAFGKSGRYYYNIVRGIDDRPVQPNRIRKSIAVERTSPENIQTLHEMEEWMEKIAEKLMQRIIRTGTKGYTLTLKMKDAQFKVVTRTKTINSLFDDKHKIITHARALLRENYKDGTPIRLLGLTISNFYQEQNPSNSFNQLKLNF